MKRIVAVLIIGFCLAGGAGQRMQRRFTCITSLDNADVDVYYSRGDDGNQNREYFKERQFGLFVRG